MFIESKERKKWNKNMDFLATTKNVSNPIMRKLFVITGKSNQN